MLILRRTSVLTTQNFHVSHPFIGSNENNLTKSQNPVGRHMMLFTNKRLVSACAPRVRMSPSALGQNGASPKVRSILRETRCAARSYKNHADYRALYHENDPK